MLDSCNIKQIFHTFLFNFRNYSAKVRNIQLREAELNITLLRVNNLDIEQKMVWNICFIICPKYQTKSRWMLTRHKCFSDTISIFF